MSQARLSAYTLISHKGHNNTIQVYSVTVMTNVIALEDGKSSQGTYEPITPVCTMNAPMTSQFIRTLLDLYNFKNL